ncbi:MAG: DUF3341 domain-containing protein [Verrucomicrobiota bacterium]
MSAPEKKEELYGITAEFDDSDVLIEAAKAAKAEGYTDFDAYTPFPVHGLFEAMGGKRTILPWIVLCAGTTGCLGGFFLQYWISVIDYPLNVGGRPMNSWPSFVPVTFECTILLSGLTALIGMLSLNGLPRPYHPIFNTPDYNRVTEDGYMICIEAVDQKFDIDDVKKFLKGVGGVNIHEVEGVLDS